MMTQAEKSQYERTSNAAAGYCAVCTKPLEPDETYSCNECASDAYVETDPNGRVTDGKPTQRGSRT